MILQALHSYYERMITDPDSGMPPYGTSIENISFALVLDKEGKLRGVEDLRETDDKKRFPRKMAVPAAVTRTSGVKANFLWDKAAYVLGADKNEIKTNAPRFAAFKELLHEIGADVADPGFAAVRGFMESWEPDEAETIINAYTPWEEVAGANLVFRLEGVRGFIHDRPWLQNVWRTHCAKVDEAPKVQCLITGEQDVPLARVHTPIKGVIGGQTSGGYIVSFNASAFVSYGRDKADVGETSAFAYTTALNALLTRGSRQKVTIGDMTIVFWAERSSPAEDFLADLFDPAPVDKSPQSQIDHHTTIKIHDLLQAIRSGRRAVDIVPNLDESVSFYLLALAPNASRLSIRFWETSTVGGLLQKVGKHFQQMEIIRQFDSDPEFPPLWRLLRQTAPLGKSENISPVLAGGMAKAMLTGSLYPQSLLPTVLGRIRAEHQVTFFRAALIKAFLIRNKQWEVPVSFDPTRTDRPYLLGRLFAILEKAQEEAIPGTSATIKDRYLGSASANPGQIFHMLLKNAANHTAKLRKDPEKKGLAFSYDKMIQDIIESFDDFPATMSSEEQGLFMIGYYHQRKDLFTKKNKETQS
ncbi:CRISPR-associated protein, Csd1 family [Desulfonatronum thiosulfatophilum]|uniref:CRISPR-associated protein, Csd1 family n=1 Tax=Desulfonatronum thiosulfatophilum TaxID=617002 RepID=A0A1G6EV49_9BACT|nr:type I-C CRISPR-associated protein Cas8c/Csd1 [Desulfonatronum thiosulfatophilum]SDB61296.1 CRISPR-associated protein, Csd1 family [Desulfonatronum thiosulfatophilum]